MRREPTVFQDTTFDVVVVGGGITGACIAHDATLRGLSVRAGRASRFRVGHVGGIVQAPATAASAICNRRVSTRSGSRPTSGPVFNASHPISPGGSLFSSRRSVVFSAAVSFLGAGCGYTSG